MNKILANCISLGIGLGAIGVTFQAQAASFQGLGDLPGGVSLALLMVYQQMGLLLLVSAIVLMVVRHSVGHNKRGW